MVIEFDNIMINIQKMELKIKNDEKSIGLQIAKYFNLEKKEEPKLNSDSDDNEDKKPKK